MENVPPKFHDYWMENAADVPKGVFWRHGLQGVSRIHGLDLSPCLASAEETLFL